MQVSEKTKENSELLGQQAPPGVDPNNPYLSDLSAEPDTLCIMFSKELCSVYFKKFPKSEVKGI